MKLYVGEQALACNYHSCQVLYTAVVDRYELQKADANILKFIAADSQYSMFSNVSTLGAKMI